MIDALRLALAWGVAWCLGIAIVATMSSTTALRRAGEVAWTIGCGYFVGAFIVTLWMRGLSLIGVDFSLASIALPLFAALAGITWVGRARLKALITSTMTAKIDVDRRAIRTERMLCYAIGAWLAIRFIVLLLDVVSMPLYPWDAWIQWATKARVWYALGHIVPFARTDAWFAANGTMWFDASPNYPATVPLWQVWSSVALGRWDDALMNLPWWITAVALAVSVFGVLRASGTSSAYALVGAWLVSSLPLGNVHVALAGYADLPMAAYFTLAALATWRWSQARTFAAASLALLLALACTTIKTPGVVWALTLVPAAVLTLMPLHGRRVVLAGLIATIALLAILARTSPVILGYTLHLDFAPAWRALVASLFVLANWHLLWYGVIAIVVLGWRDLRVPPLSTLSATLGAALLFLVVVFSFTNARNWVTDQTTINRALLHVAPLALTFALLVAHAWFARVRAPSSPVVPAVADA